MRAPLLKSKSRQAALRFVSGGSITTLQHRNRRLGFTRLYAWLRKKTIQQK